MSARAADTSSPLAQALEAAGRDLPAGGFVAAEVERETIAFLTSGHPTPTTAPQASPETLLFEIGSITKVFTGLLLAQTVVEGKAALTDPISRHLPPEVAAVLHPDVAVITLEQLATHTSGLPRLPTNFAPANPSDPYADYTVERLLAFLRDFRPSAPPPQPHAYSNLGQGLIGELLARIHGVSYAELLAQKLTGPLGLVDTVIALNPSQLARLAPPHSGHREVPPWTLPALAGAGAIRSSAADLARFAQALLRADVDTAHPLHAAWALARLPRAATEPRRDGAHIGLGVFVTTRGREVTYWHGGGTGGSRSHLEFTPATGRATVILLNNDEPQPGAVLAVSRRPGASTSAAVATAPGERAVTPLPAGRQATDYAGVYRIDAQRTFTFVVDADGQLRTRLTGQPFFPLFHAGGERFFLRVVPAELQFARDAQTGELTSVTLFQNGAELPARRTRDVPPPIRFPTDADLAAYTGRYTLTPQLEFEVTMRAHTLFAKLTGQAALPVFATAEADTFNYDVVLAALRFERDADGKVIAVTLAQGGRTQRAPRVTSD